MNIATVPKPSETETATMPLNEERRANAVLRTGLIDAPNASLFQIYCDLAKDLTGYEQARFSLFDGEAQCSMAAAGVDDSYQVGNRTARSKWNVCSYVLLDTEPLIHEDLYMDPDWSKHPFVQSGDAPHGYAGFPIINKDNYALGTLCLFNTAPKKISEEQIQLIARIAANIAILLDLQVEQRSLTAEKIIQASTMLSKRIDTATLNDFNVLLHLDAEASIDEEEAQNLIDNKLCKIDENRKVILTSAGRMLIEEMGLTPKPMKRIKLTGSDASALVDQMFSELS